MIAKAGLFDGIISGLVCGEGTGTTAWVAKKLGRKAVIYELSEEYCKLAVERNKQEAMI